MSLNCTKKGIAAGISGQGWPDGKGLLHNWEGSAKDGDWTNASNWSDGVPGDGYHAIIPGGLDHYPTIQSGDGAHVDYITIEDSGSLIGAEYLTVDETAFMQRYFSPLYLLINRWLAYHFLPHAGHADHGNRLCARRPQRRSLYLG